MKKLFIVLLFVNLLSSCGPITTSAQDTEMLQKEYTTVYKVTTESYVCIDSTNHVYHVKVGTDGNDKSLHVKIRIK